MDDLILLVLGNWKFFVYILVEMETTTNKAPPTFSRTIITFILGFIHSSQIHTQSHHGPRGSVVVHVQSACRRATERRQCLIVNGRQRFSSSLGHHIGFGKRCDRIPVAAPKRFFTAKLFVGRSSATAAHTAQQCRLRNGLFATLSCTHHKPEAGAL